MEISFNAVSPKSSYVIEGLEICLKTDTNEIHTFLSDRNYKPTNAFLNELNTNENFKAYVKALFSYDGVCHWQFFPSYVWPYVFFMIESVCILEKVFSGHNLKSIKYAQPQNIYGELFGKILKEFCQKYLCKLFITNKVVKKNKTLSSAKRLLRILFNFLRDMAFLIALYPLQKLDKKASNKILILSHKANLEIDNHKIRDRQVGTIYEALKSKYTPILTLTDWQNLKTLIKIFYHKNTIDSLIHFSSPLLLLKNYIYRCFRRIKKTCMPGEFLIPCHGIDIFPAFSVIFEHLQKYVFFETVYFRRACKGLLGKIKPKAIFLTYETGPVQRAALIEAARLKIPTFGLQHGMIFSNHYDYSHSHITQNFGEWGFQVPTSFLVFGSFWKEVLIKFAPYRHESIISVGKWNAQKPKKIQGLVDYPSDSSRVLLLTSGIQSNVFLEKCKNVLKYFNNVVLYHRPHPSEVNSTKQFEDLNIQLVSGTLEKAFEKSDYIISPVSTAVLDSMSMGKPVICFNHSKEKGWEEFQNIEGCFYCETEEQLAEIYTKLINLSSHEKEGLFEAMEKTSKSFFECFGEEALENILKVLEQKL